MERTFHMLLYRAFHAQRSYLRPCLGEIGLVVGQPKLITYLACHGPCGQRELAEYFEVDSAAVSRMVDSLEKGGFITRRPNEENRRCNSIELTEKGHRADEKGTNRYTVLVGAQNEHQLKRQKTCEKIATEIGATPIFVRRSEEFAKGVDAAEEAVPGTRQKVLSGEVKPTAAEIASVARAPPEDRPALVEKICAPKETKRPRSKSTSKAKNVEKSATSTTPCESQAEPPVIEVPSEQIVQPKQNQTALQTIRSLSAKMESVEQVADAEGMLSEVASAADTMIYRLDVCFENYPEFLKNPKIRQKVVGLLQKAKDYIVKLEGEFAYD